MKDFKDLLKDYENIKDDITKLMFIHEVKCIDEFNQILSENEIIDICKAACELYLKNADYSIYECVESIYSTYTEERGI